MQRNTILAGLAILAGSLGLPGTAAAQQQVPFETIGQGAMGPFGAGQELVIESDQELISSGVHGLLTPGVVKPDFAAGDIAIAVFMGTRNTGGYSIAIEEVVKRQLPSIMPVPAPPPAYELVVKVRRTSPPPGSIVPQVITAPYHAVKLRPGNYVSVTFEPATAAAFEAISRSTSAGGFGISKEVRVRASGEVVIIKSHPTALFAPINGTATSDELRRLERAVRDARFDTLPDRLPDPNPMPADVPVLRYLLERAGVADKQVRGTAGFLGQYASRLQPVDAILADIALRLENGGSTPGLESISRSTSGGFGGMAKQVTVRVSGEVEIQSTRSFAAPVQTTTGNATQDELRRLEQAVRDARFDTLPDRLPEPNPAPADVPMVRYLLERAGVADKEVRGTAGFLGQYASRLQPVDAVLREIEQRVESGSNAPVGNVPFTTVFKSELRGPHAAQERVLRSFDQYRDFLRPVQPPVGPLFDFNREMLIGVSMGSQSSGGYDIEVVDIQRAAPPGQPAETVVTVRRRRPSGVATAVITAPVHVVKLAKLPASDAVRFVDATPSPTGFDRVSLHTSTWTMGTSFPLTKDVRVSASGDVQILQSHPTALFAPVNGTATQAELDRLRDAIRQGDLAGVPSPLPVVVPMHLPSEPFTLTVNQSGADTRIEGPQVGIYGQWDGQLRPVIEAVQAIEQRILTGSTRDEVKGEVAVRGRAVLIREPHRTTRVTNDDQARILRKFRGLSVKVAGKVTRTGADTAEIEVTDILNPEAPRNVRGLVQERNGQPVLLLGSPFQTGPLREVEAHGAAERALGLAIGEQVTVEAWLFTDASGVAHEAYLESVAGEANAFSVLTRSGSWTGFVRPGEAVKVLALSRSGRYALVDARVGSGYLPVSRLDVGTPFTAQPTPQPAAGAAAPSGPGITGALDDAADGDD